MPVLQNFFTRILFALFFRFYPVFLRFLYICHCYKFSFVLNFFRRTAIRIVICFCLVRINMLLFLRFFRFFGFFGNSRPVYNASLAVLIRINFCMILFSLILFSFKIYKTTVVYDFFYRHLTASIIRIKPSVSDNLRCICLFFINFLFGF